MCPVALCAALVRDVMMQDLAVTARLITYISNTIYYEAINL